jgi:hypothetical protein
MSKQYIKEIGKPTDFKIILNLRNKKEVSTVLKLLIYLAFDIEEI